MEYKSIRGPMRKSTQASIVHASFDGYVLCGRTIINRKSTVCPVTCKQCLRKISADERKAQQGRDVVIDTSEAAERLIDALEQAEREAQQGREDACSD